MHRYWRYASWLMFLFCLPRAVAEAALEQPFIPAGSTVVLFPSLAGDLESERTYAEELRFLIQMAEQSSAKRVVMFWDGSDIQPSALSSLHSFKPSRADFLNAAAQLPSSTNPVVAVIWGHGGMQGQTPVFHVRGPRLTPADFKLFADKVTQGPSTWFLMFRGSGRFAGELASARRHIIASEGEVIFRNDPIGMTVLVKLLRTKPDATLRSITEAFGPAVAKWYDEQNLARTEEPTLWAGSQPARALIVTAEGDGVGARPASVASIERTRNATEAGRAPTPYDVVRVDPTDYPDADAIILKRRINYTLAANPAVAVEHDEYIQVLTPEGKEAGDFDLSYSPPHEKLDFLACEIQRPDGSVLRVDPDEIRETDDSSEAPGAALSRRKFFSMPEVSPGAIIHVRYSREWKKFPLPHVTLKLPLVDDAPARDTSITVTVPKDSPFHFRFENVAAPDPQISQTEYSSAYAWRLREIPSWEPEPLTAPDTRPALSISTFPDWKSFAGWYERIIRLADESTPEITNKTAEITRTLDGDREKVVALYNYVTGLRYVAVPLGVNSFRPHTAAGVLRNQYGDCKDKANLLNALLRSQGIEAHLVLVPRFGQAHESLPGFAFNHAISRVSLGGETLWLDTTDDVCRFGMLPPGDLARRVLVIDGKTDKLVTLPRGHAKDHAFHVTVKFDLSSASMDVRAQATGYADYALRANARRIRKRSSVPILSSTLRFVNGSFALQEQKFTSPSDLEDNFQVDATGAAIGISQLDGANRFIRSPLFVPSEWAVALHKRTQPLFLNDGYPLLLEEQAEVKLPSGARVELPSAAKNDNGPLRWSLAWSKPTDESMMVKLDCELTKGELSMTETTAFQQQLRELFTALARPAIVSAANTKHP